MKRVSIIIIGDLLSFWASFCLIIYIRYGSQAFNNEINKHLYPFIMLCLGWVLVFYLFNLYDIYKIKPTIPHLKQFGFAILTAFMLGALFFYFIEIFGISPKTNLIYQLFLFGLLSFLFRRLVYSIYSHQATRSVVLVGDTKYILELKDIINQNPQIGLRVVDHVNNLDTALDKFSRLKDSVFVFEHTKGDIPSTYLKSLLESNVEILDVAKAYERYLYKIPIEYVGQSWIIENISTKKNLIYNFLTRCIDLVFSLFILVVLSPLFIIMALLIYFYDHGPVFYTHSRVGLNGKSFKLYKFRSMVVDAEKIGAVWASKDDPRITPIGKFIRKLHIDEMPQMISILRGDMTLVGPRPERPEFVEILEKSIPNYTLRHIIRPGFTGWAQIKFRYARSEDDSREKFEYDLYYIKNRNIFMNLGIILRTIQIIFTH